MSDILSVLKPPVENEEYQGENDSTKIQDTHNSKLMTIGEFVSSRPPQINIWVAALHHRDLQITTVISPEVCQKVVAIRQNESEDQIAYDHLHELEVKGDTGWQVGVAR